MLGEEEFKVRDNLCHKLDCTATWHRATTPWTGLCSASEAGAALFMRLAWPDCFDSSHLVEPDVNIEAPRATFALLRRLSSTTTDRFIEDRFFNFF